MRFREATASELLMRVKMNKATSKLRAYGAPGSVQERPAYGLVGVRRKGGANLNQAFVWNVGTCRPDAKGEIEVRGPHESESADAGYRGGITRK